MFPTEKSNCKLRRKDERSAKAEIGGPYSVHGEITITVDGMAGAVGVSARRSSAISLTSG